MAMATAKRAKTDNRAVILLNVYDGTRKLKEIHIVRQAPPLGGGSGFLSTSRSRHSRDSQFHLVEQEVCDAAGNCRRLSCFGTVVA